MNSWLPGISKRQKKFLMAYFDENPLDWPGRVRKHNEVLTKAYSFRVTFWIALSFCWSGVGALIFFISWMNHHEFSTNLRIDGIPNLQKMHKLIKKELKHPSVSYIAEEPVLQGELVPVSSSASN
jgi:hypothetical protein